MDIKLLLEKEVNRAVQAKSLTPLYINDEVTEKLTQTYKNHAGANKSAKLAISALGALLTKDRVATLLTAIILERVRKNDKNWSKLKIKKPTKVQKNDLIRVKSQLEYLGFEFRMLKARQHSVSVAIVPKYFYELIYGEITPEAYQGKLDSDLEILKDFLKGKMPSATSRSKQELHPSAATDTVSLPDPKVGYPEQKLIKGTFTAQELQMLMEHSSETLDAFLVAENSFEPKSLLLDPTISDEEYSQRLAIKKSAHSLFLEGKKPKDEPSNLFPQAPISSSLPDRSELSLEEKVEALNVHYLQKFKALLDQKKVQKIIMTITETDSEQMVEWLSSEDRRERAKKVLVDFDFGFYGILSSRNDEARAKWIAAVSEIKKPIFKPYTPTPIAKDLWDKVGFEWGGTMPWEEENGQIQDQKQSEDILNSWIPPEDSH